MALWVIFYPPSIPNFCDKALSLNYSQWQLYTSLAYFQKITCTIQTVVSWCVMRLREEMTHISGSRRISGKYKINFRLPMSYASKIDNKTDGWVGVLFIMRVGGTWFVFRPYHWWNDMWRQEFRQDVGLRGRLVVPGSRDRSPAGQTRTGDAAGRVSSRRTLL